MNEKRDWTKVDAYLKRSPEEGLTYRETLLGRVEKAEHYADLFIIEEHAYNVHHKSMMPGYGGPKFSSADFVDIQKAVENRVLTMVHDALKHAGSDDAVDKEIAEIKNLFKENSGVYRKAKEIVESKRSSRSGAA